VTVEALAPLLTYRDLRARWRVAENTIRALVTRGELAAVEIGGRVRFHPSAVEEFEKCHAVAPTSKGPTSSSAREGGTAASPGSTPPRSPSARRTAARPSAPTPPASRPSMEERLKALEERHRPRRATA
jgi:excisionase family DNA binding protein